MKRNRSRVAAIALGSALMLVPSRLAQTPTTPTRRFEINVCDFKVPYEVARANASFTVAYVADVGDDGRPTKIDSVKNELLPNDPFVRCIKSWALPVKNERLLISFDWRHGQGWSDLTISGQSLSYRIMFEPGAFSQYGAGRMAAP